MIPMKNVLLALSSLEQIAGKGNPTALCITDENGTVLGYLQTDGMGIRTFGMARAKAYTAARMGISTAQFHERLINEQLSLADFGDSLFTSVQGGIPLKQGNRVIGAVACAGRSPSEDEQSACKFAEILLQ